MFGEIQFGGVSLSHDIRSEQEACEQIFAFPISIWIVFFPLNSQNLFPKIIFLSSAKDKSKGLNRFGRDYPISWISFPCVHAII